jgi:hypothetical protein
VNHPIRTAALGAAALLVSCAVVGYLRRLGATVVRDVTEIPGYGSFSIIQDPTGGVLGLWTSSRQ